MKMNIFSGLRDKIGEHKILARIVGCLLVAGLCAGGYFGWQEYQYRQTSEYAFERLKAALTPPNPHDLATLVDFNSLSEDLARATMQKFPFFMEGADQERNIRHIFQTALLKKFLSKDKPASKPAKEESEEEALRRPLELIPADFSDQLVQGLNLRETDGNTAFVSAKLENPILKKTFTIVMRMDRTGQGWKLKHVANAQEVVGQLREAMLARHSKLRNVFEEKNAGTTKRMEQMLPIQSCAVNAGLLSDHKTLLMVVRVLARNRGSHQINNFNLDTSITGAKGQKILQRYLNTAKPVAPGEDFDHSWTFELDASTPLARSILGAGALQCNASWQTLGVGNGEVLHIVEVPNPDKKCEIAGHDHPQGFCQTPVFLR